MAKSRTLFICHQCGYEAPQYFGRCPGCQAWNSLVEQVVAPGPAGRPTLAKPTGAAAQPRQALRLGQVAEQLGQRQSTGYPEFDRVLGGGLVPGSLVLVGGDAGIGKSTLLLQTAHRLVEHCAVLYVCAEESAGQVKLRAQRLAVASPECWERLYLLPETNLEAVLMELEALRPAVAVIDSIQALYYPGLTSAPGSVAQVRECTAALMRLAKQSQITLLLVGHITKEGAIAGPKVLEHLVDTVLHFEGDTFASHRLLRSGKNRFGASHELGIFEMTGTGLEEVSDPSTLFLSHREAPAPGVATLVACEGTRPLVVEVQALVSPTSYSTPRRAATGVDYNRLVQILAVLEKHLGVPLSRLDSYVAVAGGLQVGEPAADLGVALAVLASFRNRVVDPQTVVIGEIGLGGQVRPVQQLELRLREAAKLGFRRAIVPPGESIPPLGLEVIPVTKLLPALCAALPDSVEESVAE
ncbi:MAG: DNA repair protein RadA [Gloeomargaritaceae cyanobacterium C42_A2020_066]|nr:DNA repair protein RadA [Gloeomargaritaceae cyanobacterium C42_A2020_066]